MTNIENASDIQNYFNDKIVLITGATGFVGKLLVEKILRTCNVKKIYITMRSKKNKTIYQRLEEYFDNALYDRLKTEQKNAIKKIQMISADLSFPVLGISDFDRKLITDEVNIVLHTAATVRFDEKLRVATYINVRGTNEILRMCTEMKNLQSVVYVSSAYSNCVRYDVEEKFYKSPFKSKELLKTVECLSDDKLDLLTSCILENWPNTYAFTKSVAEDIVSSYWDVLPITMVRPSIIIATVNEPVPGWVDNYTGATGVFAGASVGLVRTFNCTSHYLADLVPADVVVNCIIAAASKVTRNRPTLDGKKQIYNCVTSTQNPLTWKDCTKLGAKHLADFPSVLMIWDFMFIPCSNRYLYLFLHYILHMIPAYIVDFCALCIGKKPKLVKGYEKITKFLDVIAYFANRQWNFPNTNTQELWNGLSEQDKKCYSFDVTAFSWDSYFYQLVQGGRIYLLNDPLDTLPQAHARKFKLKIAHYALMFCLFFLFMKLIKFMSIFIF